jgi:transposase
MVVIGVDAHKRVHAAVALDDAGRELGRWTGANSPDGWSQLLEWASASGSPRRWGGEGAWNYGRGLAQHLVAAGEKVYEVNPRWTVQGRKRARKPGKNDRLDARSVAELVRREAETLPCVAAKDDTAVLDLLLTEREGAMAEATRLRNQMHHLLLQVDPEYGSRLPDLQSKAGLDALAGYAAPDGSSSLQQQRAAAAPGGPPGRGARRADRDALGGEVPA